MPSLPKGRVARLMIVAAAAAIAGVALLLPTSPRSALHASATGRMTVYPWRPAPGATVTVRYEPGPKLANAQRLLLLGAFAAPHDSLNSEYWLNQEYWWSRLQDSLTTLERTADGTFVGRVTLPKNFLAGSFVVVPPGVSPARTLLDPQWGTAKGPFGQVPHLLVGGTASGGVSLRSLLAALEMRSFFGELSSQAADTLRRYFPDHPAGYAAAQRRQSKGVIDDLVHFFERDERSYARLDALLSARPHLDADQLIWMTSLARRIEEPKEAAKWIMRLVREHPDDPRTITFYTTLIHDVELREPPADSIRPYLPLLDTLYERAHGRTTVDGTVLWMAKTYGDRAMYDRWLQRSLQTNTRREYGYGLDEPALRDPAIRSLVTPRLLAVTRNACTLPPGKYPMLRSVEHWRMGCERSRASAFGWLSRVALLEGDTRRALTFADSSIAANALTGQCWRNVGDLRRGEALLVLGDTAAAARSLAGQFTYDEWHRNQQRDSVGRSLRPVVDSARWASLIAEAKAAQVECARRLTFQRKGQ